MHLLPERRAGLARLLAVAVLVGLALAATLLCCPVAHAGPHPALDAGTTARVAAAWPEMEAAAELAQIEPELLAGLLVHETRLLPIAARGHRGYGQMALRWWLAWLAAEGWHVEDLDDPVWGLWIVGLALGWVRWRYGLRTTASLLCTWGVGPRPDGWPQGCPYSRAVLGVARAIAELEAA
jgi:hypothetical protein